VSFYDTYLQYKNFDFKIFFKSITENKIKNILAKERINQLDFLTLLSEKASGFLEDMALKSHNLTTNNFGKTILLFIPIYISDYCSNSCLYCGFSAKNKIKRRHLDYDQIKTEAKKIAETGIKHILLLTGDAPKIATIDYIKNSVKILKKYFTGIGIEIYALTEHEYAILINEGVDSLSIYQETYNEKLYEKLHPIGHKKDYRFRLNAPERACMAKIRSVNIGALLGLDEWQKDAFFTGLHADYLQNKYMDAEVSVSLPRIRPHAGNFKVSHPVDDKKFIQIMTAFRIFMPRAGIAVSTREAPQFRNNIIKLGVTKMSAGSNTSVGGYALHNTDTKQFDISDTRSVKEMEKAITKLDYQPVFKDWQTL